MPVFTCPICSTELISSAATVRVCQKHSDGLALFNNDTEALLRAAVYTEKNNIVQEMLKGKI